MAPSIKTQAPPQSQVPAKKKKNRQRKKNKSAAVVPEQAAKLTRAEKKLKKQQRQQQHQQQKQQQQPQQAQAKKTKKNNKKNKNKNSGNHEGPIPVPAPVQAEPQHVAPLSMDAIPVETLTVPSVASSDDVESSKQQLLYRLRPPVEVQRKGLRPIFDDAALAANPVLRNNDHALLGHFNPSGKPDLDKMYLDTHAPFAGVLVGLQGSGKSHSTNVVIEGCLIPAGDTVHLKKPMSALVIHYDESTDATCEVTQMTLSAFKGAPCVRDMWILVSPSAYWQKKRQYAKTPNCRVVPLLFGFSELTSTELRVMMGANTRTDNQLYMTLLSTMLQNAEKRQESIGSYEEFLALLTETTLSDLSSMQSAPLQQRMKVLCNFLIDDSNNQRIVADSGMRNLSFDDYFKPGRLVVADLSDSFLSKKDAVPVMQVLLSKYTRVGTEVHSSSQQRRMAKLVVFDEAHKYLDSQAGSLCEDIVRLVRQMRHTGIRTLVATQSPLVLHRELLELASFVVCHRFSSPDWFRELASKVPIPRDAFVQLTSLDTGMALVYAPQAKCDGIVPQAILDHNLYHVLIRPRLTKDMGATIRNEH